MEKLIKNKHQIFALIAGFNGLAYFILLGLGKFQAADIVGIIEGVILAFGLIYVLIKIRSITERYENKYNEILSKELYLKGKDHEKQGN